MENAKQNRVFVFIDASNLWAAQKVKGKFFDLEKLQEYLKNEHGAEQIKTYYYTAFPADGTRSYSLDSKHKFYTYLKKGLQFEVRKKPLKQIYINSSEGVAIEEKGNMDVEMAIDVVNQLKNYDVMILFSGDSDFLALINFVKARGKQVYVYSSKNNIAKELISAGGYKDVLALDDSVWGRDLTHRPLN